MRLNPLGSRVVVQREEAEKETPGGLLLPSQAQGKPTRGRVVSVGPGRLLESGDRASMQVKEGDTVLFGSYDGQEVEVGEEAFLLLREEEILATIEV